MRRVNTAWTKGLKGDEKQEIEALILNNEKLLDKLAEILYNMREEKKITVLSDYDSPSWSHKQAHLNGQLDMIAKILDLILIKERDDHPTI